MQGVLVSLRCVGELTAGRGPVNKEGVAFYNRLIDGLLAKGRAHLCTLMRASGVISSLHSIQ